MKEVSKEKGELWEVLKKREEEIRIKEQNLSELVN